MESVNLETPIGSLDIARKINKTGIINATPSMCLTIFLPMDRIENRAKIRASPPHFIQVTK